MTFVERMKKVLNQGLESTKEALDTAAEKAKEMGEKGVLRYEISRLEREAERKFAILGNDVYQVLVERGQQTVSKNTGEIKVLLEELGDLERRIRDKEASLKQIGLTSQ